jgi:hypothetical protein
MNDRRVAGVQVCHSGCDVPRKFDLDAPWNGDMLLAMKQFKECATSTIFSDDAQLVLCSADSHQGDKILVHAKLDQGGDFTVEFLHVILLQIDDFHLLDGYKW